MRIETGFHHQSLDSIIRYMVRSSPINGDIKDLVLYVSPLTFLGIEERLLSRGQLPRQLRSLLGAEIRIVKRRGLYVRCFYRWDLPRWKEIPRYKVRHQGAL